MASRVRQEKAPSKPNVRLTKEGRLEFIGRAGKPYHTSPFTLFAKTKSGSYAPVYLVKRAKNFEYAYYDPNHDVVIDTGILAKTSDKGRTYKRVIKKNKEKAARMFTDNVWGDELEEDAYEQKRISEGIISFPSERYAPDEADEEEVPIWQWQCVCIDRYGNVVRRPVSGNVYTLGLVLPNGEYMTIKQMMRKFRKRGSTKEERESAVNQDVLFRYDAKLAAFYEQFFVRFPNQVVVYVEQRIENGAEVAYLSDRPEDDEKLRMAAIVNPDGQYYWYGVQWYVVIRKSEAIYIEGMLQSNAFDPQIRTFKEAATSRVDRKWTGRFTFDDSVHTLKEVTAKMNFASLFPHDKGTVGHYHIEADVRLWNIDKEPVELQVSVNSRKPWELARRFVSAMQYEIQQKGYHFTTLQTLDALLSDEEEKPDYVEGRDGQVKQNLDKDAALLIDIRNNYEKLDEEMGMDASLAPKVLIKYDVWYNLDGQFMWKKGQDVELRRIKQSKGGVRETKLLKVENWMLKDMTILDYVAKLYDMSEWEITRLSDFKKEGFNKVFVHYGKKEWDKRYEMYDKFE